MPSVALAGAAMWQPWLILGGAPLWAVLHRRRSISKLPGPDDEARFLRALASELNGGASLRTALAVSADHSPRLDLGLASRLAASGLSGDRVAEALGNALPVNGRLAGAAWLLASRSGGPAASVMQTLAALAADEGALHRERRSLTAQARASAWVVAALPPLLLLVLIGGGRLELSDPALVPIVAVGLALQGAGVAAVVWMLRKAER